MATIEEVTEFLKEFKQKIQIWEVLFRDSHGRNCEALAELELRPSDRKMVLDELEIEDFCEGPIEDKVYVGLEVWVFGRIIKRKEVYIKIIMGAHDSKVICVSFHVAEHKLKLSLKTN